MTTITDIVLHHSFKLYHQSSSPKNTMNDTSSVSVIIFTLHIFFLHDIIAAHKFRSTLKNLQPFFMPHRQEKTAIFAEFPHPITIGIFEQGLKNLIKSHSRSLTLHKPPSSSTPPPCRILMWALINNGLYSLLSIACFYIRDPYSLKEANRRCFSEGKALPRRCRFIGVCSRIGARKCNSRIC